MKIEDFYNLFPEKNCGVCGFAWCRTTARNLALGKIKLEDCVYLKTTRFKENYGKIKRALEEGIEIGSKTVIRTDEGIILIHPCYTKGKTMGELQLKAENLKFGYLDLKMLNYLLLRYKEFNNVKFSDKLDVITFDYDDRNIFVFGNGLIRVKKANNKDDLRKTIDLISRLMWGSLICSWCGSTAVECAAGACEPCSIKLCDVLSHGSPAEEKTEPKKTISIAGISDAIKEPHTRIYFEHSLQALDELNKKIKKIDVSGFEEKIRDIQYASLKFIVETPEKEKASYGLILLGISLFFENVFAALEELLDKKDKDAEMLNVAIRLFNNAYEAFKENSNIKAEEVIKNYSSFLKQKFESETALMMRNIASNAYYLARIMSKKFPA